MRPEHPELMWSEDRLHLGPLGHQAVAIEVLDTLGVPHDVVLSDPTGSLGETPFQAGRRADLEWAVRHAAPVDQAAPHREVLRRRDHSQTAGPRADLTARRASGTIPHAGSPACGCSSVGRARPSQGRCREFESRHPLRVFRRTRSCSGSRENELASWPGQAPRSSARRSERGASDEASHPTRRPARPAGFETVAERPPQPAAGGFREAEATEPRPRATPSSRPQP